MLVRVEARTANTGPGPVGRRRAPAAAAVRLCRYRRRLCCCSRCSPRGTTCVEINQPPAPSGDDAQSALRRAEGPASSRRAGDVASMAWRSREQRAHRKILISTQGTTRRAWRHRRRRRARSPRPRPGRTHRRRRSPRRGRSSPDAQDPRGHRRGVSCATARPRKASTARVAQGGEVRRAVGEGRPEVQAHGRGVRGRRRRVLEGVGAAAAVWTRVAAARARVVARRAHALGCINRGPRPHAAPRVVALEGRLGQHRPEAATEQAREQPPHRSCCVPLDLHNSLAAPVDGAERW